MNQSFVTTSIMCKFTIIFCILCPLQFQSQNTFVVKSNAGFDTHSIHMLQKGEDSNTLEYRFEFTANRCCDINLARR